jgi:hypothetical protein
VSLERARDAERKGQQRANERDLRIPRIEDVVRRNACLEDTYEFLRVYFGGIFSQPFTETRRTMIDAIERAATYGGDQAIAGPRGDGKTRSALFVTLKLMLKGVVRFPLIISKSGSRAGRELKNLKDAIRDNTLLMADFPEVIFPIKSMGRWASRALQQTAYGEFTNMEWGEECIILPTLPSELLWRNGWNEGVESAATGQIVASLGIEGPVRGYSVRNERPDLAILDDIDDRESARSELQTQTRELIIEEDVGGLAGPDKTIARVMLCTLINRTCIAAKFTNKKDKPSWRGQRHKLLAELPTNEEAWNDYISLREGRGDDDPDARKATELYKGDREAMDAGAVVTNPYRFDPRPLEDGEPGQLSALQACYDIIADRGWEHFNTEYQNDPPEEETGVTSGITAHKVARCLSGYPRRTVPPECHVLTQGVDVKKDALHWVIKAWRADATNYVIDYGVTDVIGTTYGSDEGVERAIYRAVLRRMEELRQVAYVTADGESRQIGLTLVDSGWMTQAVYHACFEIGMGIYPAKGHGRSEGCATVSFSPAKAETDTIKPGDGWRMDFESIRAGKGVWRVGCDTDRWKAFEHARWLTPEGKPGAAYLFGGLTEEEQRPDSRRVPRQVREHDTFAKHITAEVEVEDIVRGVLKRVWQKKTGRANNHYLDASYLSDVAAAMLGIRLLGNRQIEQPKRPAVVSAGRSNQSRW